MKKEIEINGKKITLKKEYLTWGEVKQIVEQTIEIYNQGGLIKGYSLNPVEMELNFYGALFYCVIEDFSLEDDDKLNELLNAGVQYELLDCITNADRAYDLMWITAENLSNTIGGLLDTIKGFLSNLPSGDALKELSDKLPDEWKKTFNQYNEITGKEEK